MLLTLTLALPSYANDHSHQQASQDNVAIAIHGGAGTISKTKMSAEKRAKYDAKISEAVNKGFALLAEGNQAHKQLLLQSKY